MIPIEAIQRVIEDLQGMFEDYDICFDMSAQDAYADALFKLREVIKQYAPSNTRNLAEPERNHQRQQAE